MAPYRILVVDDSAFMRKIISDIIEQDPQFTVIATASNGREALDAVTKWMPDAVTLDLEMPLMNGLEALQGIMKKNPVPVIMLSGISEDNTRETIKALQFGAFDFIRKPSSAISNDIHHVSEALIEKLRIAVLTKRHQPIIKIQDQPLKREAPPKTVLPKPEKPRNAPAVAHETNKQVKEQHQPKQKAVTPLHKKHEETHTVGGLFEKPKLAEQKDRREPMLRKAQVKPPSEAARPAARGSTSASSAASFQHIVAIGTSTGGPRALHEVISSLPGDLPAPVLVVQHMPPKFTKSLAQRLDSFSGLEVVEAEQGETVKAGVVYIAPGGYHMELAKNGSSYRILLTEEPQRNGHRPSVDVLFESLLPYEELERHAVIMTGMGSDGTKGLKKLQEAGVSSTFAEAEESCVVYGMPRAAIEAGCVNKVIPLQHIASQIVHAVLK